MPLLAAPAALAILLALALLGGCSSSGGGAMNQSLQGTVRWVHCRGAAGPAGFDCASIAVPRDPADPTRGGTIQMALDRHRASATLEGTVVVNPGGPGASGVDFLPSMVAEMPKSLLDHYEIVGFDPPGVARTAPIICLDNTSLQAYFGQDPAPTTSEGVGRYVAEARRFADGCQQHSAAELPYVSTVDAAMDMDVLRGDLGEAKLTYLGFSYGTFLGATYAGLYPTRVRAMVLDGAVDPNQGVIAGVEEQSAALEGDLGAALTACQESAKCPWKPAGNPVAAYETLLSRVRVSPVAVPGSRRKVGPAELIYGTASTLYSTATWTDLDQALAGLAGGNGTLMLQLFDSYTGRSPQGSYNNEFEANAAVSCLDDPVPPLAAIEAGSAAAAATAPVFGVTDLYGEIGCALWPLPASGHPGAITAPGSPPILVVGTTGDPATPYPDAVALASELQHGLLLTRVGYGHTAYRDSACVRRYVDSYLSDLSLPPAGTRCPSG